ncbi:hypothetical protein ACK389_16235 [Streptomyces antibioticus]|uniref:hypothetical protein n=1 Tax=Streptomyces antibioticus TaxID=1890 RepID=UPI0033ED5040
MRRTAPLLSAVALAGALLAAAGPVASADPAAEVSPGSVDPGGSVTVSVTCDPPGGTAPETIDASSLAFADGTVRLTRVTDTDDPAAGLSYRGTARSSGAADLDADEGLGPDTAWTVDGTCPAPPDGEGSPWSATFDITRASGGGSCPPEYGDTGSPCGTGRPTSAPTHHTCSPSAPPHTGGDRADPCAPPTVEHGVRAGAGGSLGDSVPALIAGGVLIAGAAGAAGHRLYRRARDA